MKEQREFEGKMWPITDWSWWGGPAREVDETGTFWWDTESKEQLLHGALEEVEEGEVFVICEARSYEAEPDELGVPDDHVPFAEQRNEERYRKENGHAVKIDD